MTPRIYLAGPDVFFPDAEQQYQALQAKCRAHGCEGIRPSDGDLARGGSGAEKAERIYAANVSLLRACDAVLANLMPFRNALEPDSGTVFEVGFAVALGKPVAGYLPRGDQPCETRVAEVCGRVVDAQGTAWDAAHGYLIEAFGEPLNLMLSRSSAIFGSVDAALAHLARRFGVV